jgi:purine-binding chemotaxis protein CheW
VSTSPLESVLIVAVGALRCALRVSCVVETMRPLPLHALAGAPRFVLGASVIRGEAVPVVDLAGLVGEVSTAPTRFVVVRAGEHRAALAVERVVGVRNMDVETVGVVPPLLAPVASEAIAALGSLDTDLLAVLRTAQIVPDEVWGLLANWSTP